MTSQTKHRNTNPKDKYLIVYIDTNEVYTKFRTIGGATVFLCSNPLRVDLKIIPNPKYVTPIK